MEYYQVSQTVAGGDTLKRELAAVKNTGDYHKKTILTMDLLESSEDGIMCRNLINWLLSAG